MNVDIVVNQVYKPYLNDDTRTQIFFGGSSSGKSYYLAQRTILDMLKGKRNYLIVRNVKETIRKSVFNEIKKAIIEMGLSSVFQINHSDLAITCKLNNKQILFAGLDDPEKIKSITPIDGVISDVWIEEATECSSDAVNQLNLRLRGRSEVKKRLIMSFNPIYQTHWIYKKYFMNWTYENNVYKDDGLLIVQTTYKDNDFLEEDDIQALENIDDPYFRDVYVYGKWGILGDVIFKNWEVQDLSEKKEHFDRFKNGLDFGFAKDPSAVVRLHYDKKKKALYILDELYEHELTNDLLAEKLLSMIGREYIICDSAEPKSIKELNNHGVKALGAKKGKDSVIHGIKWLRQQKIIIDKECQHTRNEFELYQWKKDKQGNSLPVPIDENDHAIDAIRYACEEYSNYINKSDFNMHKTGDLNKVSSWQL